MLVLVMAVVVLDKSAGLCLHLCTTIRKSTKDGLFLYKTSLLSYTRLWKALRSPLLYLHIAIAIILSS